MERRKFLKGAAIGATGAALAAPAVAVNAQAPPALEGQVALVTTGTRVPARAPEDMFKKNDSLCARMKLDDIKEHCRDLIIGFNALHSPKVIADRCRRAGQICLASRASLVVLLMIILKKPV